MNAAPPDTGDAEARKVAALAQSLTTEPDLAELVDVWKLFDEPIRAGIMAMVRATPKA